MQDKIGVPLNVGDTVIYAKRGDDDLHLATIEKFTHEGQYATIRRISTGRISQNPRMCNELLSVEIIRESNPEYFI